jgi:hypothetical protein
MVDILNKLKNVIEKFDKTKKISTEAVNRQAQIAAEAKKASDQLKK